MQLTIRNGELIATNGTRRIYITKLMPLSTVDYYLARGFRATTAQAVAFGLLADREKTILLAQLVKLLSK